MWYSVKLGVFERNFGDNPKMVLNYLATLSESDKERVKILRNYGRTYVEEIDTKILTDASQ